MFEAATAEDSAVLKAANSEFVAYEDKAAIICLPSSVWANDETAAALANEPAKAADDASAKSRLP